MRQEEPLDQFGKSKEDPLQEYFENKREKTETKWYTLVILGFVVLGGIKVWQTWPEENSIRENQILNRQTELLQQLQQTEDSFKVQQIIVEYDSLQDEIDGLD